MTNSDSDALVFFAATSDLAYKKIFPGLQAMLQRGHLDLSVIGVAKAGWTPDRLRARVHDSLEKHGAVDPAAFDKLSSLLRYVDGHDSEANAAGARMLFRRVKSTARLPRRLNSPSRVWRCIPRSSGAAPEAQIIETERADG